MSNSGKVKKAKKEKKKLTPEQRKAQRQARLDEKAERSRALATQAENEATIGETAGPRAVSKYRQLMAVEAQAQKLRKQLIELGVSESQLV